MRLFDGEKITRRQTVVGQKRKTKNNGRHFSSPVLRMPPEYSK